MEIYGFPCWWKLDGKQKSSKILVAGPYPTQTHPFQLTMASPPQGRSLSKSCSRPPFCVWESPGLKSMIEMANAGWTVLHPKHTYIYIHIYIYIHTHIYILSHFSDNPFQPLTSFSNRRMRSCKKPPWRFYGRAAGRFEPSGSVQWLVKIQWLIIINDEYTNHIMVHDN